MGNSGDHYYQWDAHHELHHCHQHHSFLNSYPNSIIYSNSHQNYHHHQHDYILVIDSGDLVAGIPPKDSGMDFFVGKVPAAGNTVRVPKGGIEWALNVGKKRYHEVLIELKKT